MARYSVETLSVHRDFVLIEADSEQEALELVQDGQFNDEDIVDTVVEAHPESVVVHGIFEDQEGECNMSRFVVREELKCTEWFLLEADTAEEALQKFEDGEVDRSVPMDTEYEPFEGSSPVVEKQFDQRKKKAMAKYLLRVPVSGDEYYVVEADSVEEAISLANEDPYDLSEPVETCLLYTSPSPRDS